MTKLGQSNTFLTTFLYNHVNIPSSTVLKCSCCNSQQTEKHLKQQLGKQYFSIPDRYVDIFVCNFCKKLDQPKCIYCWQMRPCCGYKEKILYKEYFSSLKKEILSCSGNLIKSMNKYNKSSQQFTPSSQIINKLILALNKAQQQLKQQINDKIHRKNDKVIDKYKCFEKAFIQRLKDGSSGMNLVQQRRVLEEMEEFRRQLQDYGWEESDRYMQRVSEQYNIGLFTRIDSEFRHILTPMITYKSSLTQTIQNSNQLSSGSSNNNNSINPCIEMDRLQSKVKELQKQLSQSLRTIQLKQVQIESLSNKIALLTSSVNDRSHQGNNVLMIKKQQQSTNTMKSSNNQKLISKPLRKEQRKNIINTSQFTTNREKSSSWLQDVVKQMAE